MVHTLTQQLIDFINASPTMFHTVDTCIQKLEEAHFKYLDPTTNWDLHHKGGKFYTTINNSGLIAFRVGSSEYFKIVGTHGDAPGFRIKPNAQMKTEEYVKLNTEGYGGAILSTWFDRPLSIAGRVALRSDDVLHPKMRLVDLNAPLLIIPSLAIHMNREMNDGVKLNKQKDTLPILTYSHEAVSNDLLENLVAENLQVSKEDILSMELYVYPYEKGLCVGLDDVFISSPRLDDLSMVYSGLYALLNHRPTRGIAVFVCFDNEEIGSHTKQGAGSPFLIRTLERILIGYGLSSREALFKALEKSFIVSADVAHLTHPNYSEKGDPTNIVRAGKGPAIKVASSFSYTTDSDSFGVFAGLCQKHDIPYQVFVNRSDERGGSTIGPISTAHLGIRSVDIGTPMLAMHSAWELMAQDDFIHTTKALQNFFSS